MSWTKFRPFTDYVDIKDFTGHSGNDRDWRAELAPLDLVHFSKAEGCCPVSGEVFDYKRKDDSKEPCKITCGVYFIRVDDKSAKDNKETPSGYYDYIGLSANFKKNDFQSGIFGRLFDHYRKLVCLPSRGNFGELITKYQLGVDLSDLNKKERKKIISQKYKTLAIQDLEKQHFRNYDELREYFGASHIENDINLYGTTEYFHKVFQECRKRNDLNSIGGINKFFTENVSIAFYEHNFSGNSQFYLNADGTPKLSKDGTPQINGKWTKFIEFISKGEGVALATYQKQWGMLPFLNKRDEIMNLDNLPKGFN
tara:strand:- start:881 stop:1813 length:933 start_codon:yes stop_codon:yes gene_type:complete